MTIKPLITIITVVYNGAAFLEKTILSVINQTYDNVEYIIIDGGSYDGTIDIVKKYEDKIYYWVSEQDDGIYDAMNKGITLAHGDWIVFLNSGDSFCDNDILENIFPKNMTLSAEIIYGNTKVRVSNKTLKPPRIINKKYFFYQNICHQSIFFKRGVFTKYGYYNLKYKIIADREWLLKATIKNVHFLYVDLDICIWDAIGFSSKNIYLYTKEDIEFKKFYFSPFERLLLPWAMRYENYRRKLQALFYCLVSRGVI